MNRDEVVAGGVAASAFACSAMHIYSVALDAGNPMPIAVVHPLGLDGLIYIGIRAVQRGRRVTGWLGTAYGVVMSLAFNAASYAHVPLPTWVMALAMPAALVLAVLVVHGSADEPTPAPRKRAAPKPIAETLTPTHAVKPDPVPSDRPADPPPESGRRPQGVHKRGGQLLRGDELKRDAIDLVLGSVTPERPFGMSNADLAKEYTPPLASRKTEDFGAEARRRIRQNGHAVR